MLIRKVKIAHLGRAFHAISSVLPSSHLDPSLTPFFQQGKGFKSAVATRDALYIELTDYVHRLASLRPSTDEAA